MCQMMKRRIVMKLEMYQAMIKAPLTLQRRMTGHYERRNHFAREKLKTAQNEGLAQKNEKYQARLSILAQYFLQVSKDP